MPGICRFTFLVLLANTAFAQAPVPAIITSGPLCTNSTISFSAAPLDSGFTPNTYSWSVIPVTAVPLGDTDLPTAAFTFSNPGTFQVKLTQTVINDTNAYVVTKLITVTRAAKAAFNASLTEAGYPTSLVLTNFSSNALKFAWHFSNGVEPDTSVHVTKQFTTPGPYSVTLIATGRNGCDHSASYRFYISDSSGVTLPNIFTPNSDGVNDIYRPISRGLSTMHARVYNRDGIIMSEWTLVNGFWDGYTTAGEPCDEGVYFITVEARGFNNQSFKKNGTITLMR